MWRELTVGLAGQALIRDLFRADGRARQFALRFVAGESREEAATVARNLNAIGMATTLDHLGEHVQEGQEATIAARDYCELLDYIAQAGVAADIALKPSQMGLDIDLGLARENSEMVVARANALGNFVWLDMESSDYTDATLDLFRRLRERFDEVGVAMQAALFRSHRDVEELIELRARVRLCKGAYLEPPDIAYARKEETDRNFIKLMETLLLEGNQPAVATHDERIINRATEMARSYGIGRDRFEFQMLYGVRRDLQQSLARQGYRVRIYVPYGRNWYPYLVRRLAERPSNLFFVMASIFRESLHGLPDHPKAA